MVIGGGDGVRWVLSVVLESAGQSAGGDGAGACCPASPGGGGLAVVEVAVVVGWTWRPLRCSAA